MTTKQPDRFERLVRKGFKRTLPANQEWIYVTDAIDLLREEHQAMVKMVKHADATSGTNTSIDFQAGEHTAYMDILSKLNERAK